jgi:hypothetical protein
MEYDMEVMIGTVAFGDVSRLSNQGPVVALYDLEEVSINGDGVDFDDSLVTEVVVKSEDDLKVGDPVVATFKSFGVGCYWEAKRVNEV